MINILKNYKNFLSVIKDYIEIKKQLKNNNNWKIKKFFTIFGDKKDSAGSTKGHYFHQDLLIARKIYKQNPKKHVDIGSRIDGFIAHVASFRKVEVFDIRPLKDNIEGINFVQANLMNLDNKFINYTDSISSLHAIEHFGLGRYGDPIDVNGYLKGLENIYNILKKGGIFYFSVPIGSQRIEFNAHRIFNIRYLLNIFEGKYILNNFSYVNDNGDLFENISINQDNINSNFGCNYGCGIFELLKL